MFFLAVLLAAAEAVAPAAPAPAITPPQLLAPLDAPYPDGERPRSAAVELELVIDASGAVTGVSVTTSAGPAFDAAAVAGAQKLRFSPAIVNGQPAPSRVSFRVAFEPPPEPNAPELAVLSGTVLERGTRDPLEGAVVEVGAEQATTDRDGHFTLRAPPGPNTLQIGCAEHESATLEATLPAEVTVRLRRHSRGFSATVTASKAPATVVRTLAPEEAAKAPGTQGDVLRAVADLPGVARPPLGLGVLVVRGGAPEDTKVFLEGDEIPLAFHLGALSAVVNTDTLAGLDFIPGAFPVRYGRATAGVIELRTRPGGERLHGYVQADLVNAAALVEGPLGDAERGTFIVSARRSYLDSILRQVLPLTGLQLTVAPKFTDYQARVDLKLAKGELHFGAFGSQDELGLVLPADGADPQDTVGSSNGFHRLYLGWTRPLARGITNQLQFSAGFDAVDVAATRVVQANYVNWRSTLRDEVRATLGPNLKLAGGVDLQLGRTDITFRTPNPFTRGSSAAGAGDPSAAILTISERLPLVDPGAYVQATWENERFVLVPALRVDHAEAIHQTWFDPRFSGAVRVLRDENLGDVTVKVAAGLHHMRPRPDLLIPTFGNPNLPAERAVQASAGALWERKGLRLEATAYEAWLSDLPVFTRASAAGTDGGTTPMNFAATGTGQSKGLELLARYELAPGRYGWLAYTFSRSVRDEHQGHPEHRYDFDQPHVLTAVGAWRIAEGWSVGGRVRYASGNPTTPVARAVLDAGDGGYFSVDGPLNADRLPAFFQLDLRADKEWTFDAWKLSAYLDILNATNHANAEKWKYNYDYSSRVPYRGVPFFPSIGVQGEL